MSAPTAPEIIDLIMAELPEGVGMFAFVFSREEDAPVTACLVLGSCDVREFVPLIRQWLERVEAGDDGFGARLQ